MKNTLLVLHPGVEAADSNAVASNESLKGAHSAGRKGSLAPRLASFKGRRIAVLDNTKVNAVELDYIWHSEELWSDLVRSLNVCGR